MAKHRAVSSARIQGMSANQSLGSIAAAEHTSTRPRPPAATLVHTGLSLEAGLPPVAALATAQQPQGQVTGLIASATHHPDQGATLNILDNTEHPFPAQMSESVTSVSVKCTLAIAHCYW
jgi:hypothetical protein